MFIKVPGYDGRKGIEVDDIREMHEAGDFTVLSMDDHNGGIELMRIRQSLDVTVKHVNHAKLYAARFVANDAAERVI